LMAVPPFRVKQVSRWSRRSVDYRKPQEHPALRRHPALKVLSKSPTTRMISSNDGTIPKNISSRMA